MFEAPKSRYLVPFDGSFRMDRAPTEPAHPIRKKASKDRLEELQEELSELQRMLYARDQWSVLAVFQAMDAAGKDSTIRAVMRGVNPAGCMVRSFKKPSENELDHDFLWRTTLALPQRGRIGVFNRSYYEEVLVVRVHPNYLKYQRLPDVPAASTLWEQRYESIRDHEKHLARNGTAIVKFFLNVSQDEQRNRFLSRIDEPEKNWKFNAGDLKERELWPAYMEAYEDALNATSRESAPWYAIPADDKPTMRVRVAEILVATMRSISLGYPAVSEEARAELQAMRASLGEA